MSNLKYFFIIFLLLFCNLTLAEENSQAPLPPQKETISPEEEIPYPFLEELKKAETQGDTKFYKEFVNMLITLGVLVGVILLIAWILKRWNLARLEQVNQASSIKIIERRALTPKTVLYILNIFDKNIAIADSVNGVTLLTEIKEGQKLPLSSFEQELQRHREKSE